jgi:hypothetical protein
MNAPHSGLFGSAALFLAWSIVFAAVIAGWGLASFAIGPGAGSRARRGAIALGSAAVMSVLAAFTARLVAESFSLPPPLVWLRTIAPAKLTVYDALVSFALAQAALFPLWALFAALIHRHAKTPKSFEVPLRQGLAVLLAVCALASPFLLKPLSHAASGPGLLELVALLPMVCAALSIWTASSRVAAEVSSAPETGALGQALAAFDVPKAWRKARAIGANSTPLITTAAKSAPAAEGWTSVAWRAAGAFGPQPSAFDDLALRWSHPGKSYLVGDAPDVSEHALTVASALLAMLRDGLRCIVITAGDGVDLADSAAQCRDDVIRAFREMGAWRVGELVVGAKELKSALAENRLPAAAFFNVNDLSAEGISALCGLRGATGPLWASGVGLALVSKLDRGTPLQVTHRMFTLRRLSLALRAAGASWAVQATGFAGTGSRALLERAFPGFDAREVPLGVRATSQARAWLTTEGFRAESGEPWVTRALAPIAAAGLEVSIGDPLGAFDRSVQTWGKSVRLVRDLTFAGRSSASALNEAWLVASYRAMGNLPPREDGQPHDALWGISPSPVTRLLLKNRNLQELMQAGRLPSPRPLVGHDNSLIAKAHLRAALREGHGLQDLESLRALFSRSIVEQVLGNDMVPVRWVMRTLPSGPDLVRVPLAAMATQEEPNPVRDTVTDRVVRVIDENGGAELLRIDEFLSPTRFYPERVFAHGDSRYKVPFNAYDEKRRELRVARAQGESLTAPLLDIDVESPVVIEAQRERSFGGLRYEIVGLEVTAVERVTGSTQLGAGEPRIQRYAEVKAQYRTKARGIFFRESAPLNVLNHLARSLDSVLVALLLAGEEDIEVVPIAAGLIPGASHGMVAIDRHVGGMGVIGALDGETVDQALQWVRAILQDCSCANGCSDCTPARALAQGPDKVSVLRLLGA